MKRIFICLLVFLASKAGAQPFSRYVIQFTNKATSPYSLGTPLQYLSRRALDRRARYGIAVDSTDLPVTPRYVDSVRLAGTVTVLNVSRWLNSVSIQTADTAALAKIANLTFVQTVAPIATRMAGNPGKGEILTPVLLRTADVAGTAKTEADYFNYGLSYNQVHLHNGEFLHNIGLRGQSMIIGILDGGFYRYTSLKAFDSVNANGQVLGTYDFVKGETSVVEDGDHGMQCFSVIAANLPGQFVGTAPKASFYLFRSEEEGPENPVEEHNWVCAAERLDSAGGDLISCSLGYADQMSNVVFDHTYAQMDGNTTIAAKGADLAAKKGILVVNAVGNEGSGSWHYLTTPADGDSVMAVGAVNAAGAVAGFSSYGPSSDGQIKPDVASMGVASTVQTSANTIGTNSGTSFACPAIAGLTACLWQGFPEASNMRIITALRQAGSQASSPDNRVGYGIPDVKKAVLSLLKDYSTASVANTSCRNTITFTSKDVSTMKYEIERKAPGEATFTKIGERQSTGGNFASRTYQYTDDLTNLQTGAISYRIREIIDTAAATFTADYTDTVTVTSNASCITGEEMLLLPNPVTEKVTLKISTPYPVQNLWIRTTDAKGSLVSVVRKTKTSGTASFTIPTYHLARGKYFVSIYNGEKRIATKELLKL